MSKKFIIFGIVAIVLIFLGALFIFQKINADQSTEVEKQAALELEGKTSVNDKALAAKVDYARKIINIKDAGQKGPFEQAVAGVGGSIIDQVNETTFVVQLNKNKVEEQSATLAKNEIVGAIDVDYPVTVVADAIDWGVERIQAPKVWDKTAGSGVKVAVLDTGVDAGHIDLNGSVGATYNAIDGSTNVADGHGHGTHVSGTITALKNEVGYLGGSYQVSLMSGKVLADSGMGYISDVVQGIDWARVSGARIINLSLGSSYNSSILEGAVNRATSAGVLVIAAAGNTGGPLIYPAAYSSVISVGATDSNNNIASFSARGATVVAPGVGITSTLPGNRYAAWSGTSMATPHVSAAAALLIAKGESNVRQKLTESATDLGTPGQDGVYGNGLINIDNAINIKDTTPPLISITDPDNDATVSGKIKLSANATDESGIKQVDFKLGTNVVKTFTGEPFETEYDTTKIADGTYDFFVVATDQKDNTATVKIVIKINNASPEPTPKPSPSEGSPGNSTDNRQDSAPGNPSQEHRQNEINNPNNSENNSDSNIPTGTNYGNRGQSESKKKNK